MRAVRMHQTGSPEVLAVEEVARPEPGPGQILVQVGVAGVNYADVGMRGGMMGGQTPRILGFEAAGRVAAVGDGVDPDLEGRLVTTTCQGGYAEYALARAGAALPVPDGVDLRHAVAVPVQGITAYGVLVEAARMTDDDAVLVSAAAGGVGSLAVQIAGLLGASTVIGLASSEDKRALIRDLGATDAVDYTAADWEDRVRAAVPPRGDGGPIAVALDSVGGDTAAVMLRLLRHRSGRMVTYGQASGRSSGFAPFDLAPGNLRLVGFTAQAWQRDADWYPAAGQRLLDWIAAEHLQVIARDAWPLEEAAAAHAAVEARRTTGKVTLVVADV